MSECLVVSIYLPIWDQILLGIFIGWSSCGNLSNLFTWCISQGSQYLICIWILTWAIGNRYLHKKNTERVMINFETHFLQCLCLHLEKYLCTVQKASLCLGSDLCCISAHILSLLKCLLKDLLVTVLPSPSCAVVINAFWCLMLNITSTLCSEKQCDQH